jgi:hypothetical protein
MDRAFWGGYITACVVLLLIEVAHRLAVSETQQPPATKIHRVPLGAA